MAQALNFNTQIVRTPNWTPNHVRSACIANDFYTLGTNEEYEAMLSQVAKFPNPSDIALHMIAKDIAEHSEGVTTTNVMFILANDAVFYTFTLDGRDDI